MKPLKIFENAIKTKIASKSIFEAMGSVKLDQLIKAINTRQYINFHYTDKTGNGTSGPRFGEPFAIGTRVNSKGQEVTYLRMYVISDTLKDNSVTDKLSRRKSKSQKSVNLKTGFAKVSGWRMFIVDDKYIKNLYLSGKKFSQYRSGYNDLGDKFITNIIAQQPKSDFPKGENTDTNLDY